MRSESDTVTGSPVRDTDRNRAELARAAEGALGPGERIVAMLPYVHAEKRPKKPFGKVKVGIYQSSRRFRPLVLTDRRLLVFDTSWTPAPRGVLAAVPIPDTAVVGVAPARFHTTRVVLDLPGVGQVPFVAGRKDQDGLDALLEVIGRRADEG